MLASGSEGIVARIKMAQGAIGYVEYGFPKRLGLPMAALQNKSGKFVSPDARSGQLALTGGAPPLKELDASVIDPVGAAAYPVVSYSWLAINQKYSEPAKGTAIREFIDWGLSHGQEQGVDLGYVPLSAGVIQMSKHALGAPGL
jgi:phosphate transport system substrate-binding protein